MPSETVGQYMVRDVQYVTPNMTVDEVIDKLLHSNFHGFPVVENGYLLGYVTAKELLRFTDTPRAKLRSVMSRGTLCAIPSMSIDDATRILFRYGLRNLPVVDENKKLVGIISNIDVVRSQIEKSRPGKVMNVKNFMEKQNNVTMRIHNGEVPIAQMIPTQKEVYMDELVGRQYEIKRGLNEPIIVIKRRNGFLVVDGHHRIMAAHRLGLTNFNCIILEPNDMDVHLGLEITAEKWGLHSLDDVKIIEGSKHPFMEITTMLMPQEIAGNINNVLMERMEAEPGPGMPNPMIPRTGRRPVSVGGDLDDKKPASKKKAPAKKAASKKDSDKKPAAKKPAAKKSAEKKPAAKKAPVKKPAAKKKAPAKK
ncbi:MAG: CBS domain-containing protein [Candidatus Methanomethylophilus sp.]|nr:CBS domain-containing protein [Methanomethylophilus sp.]